MGGRERQRQRDRERREVDCHTSRCHGSISQQPNIPSKTKRHLRPLIINSSRLIVMSETERQRPEDKDQEYWREVGDGDR